MNVWIDSDDGVSPHPQGAGDGGGVAPTVGAAGLRGPVQARRGLGRLVTRGPRDVTDTHESTGINFDIDKEALDNVLFRPFTTLSKFSFILGLQTF